MRTDHPKTGCIVALVAIGWAATTLDAAAAPAPIPTQDRPGTTSTTDRTTGFRPLSVPDVQFYLSTMQAAVARYHQPSAQDVADLAESTRLQQLATQSTAKMAADYQAGNAAQAAKDAFAPTPQQQATLERGKHLRGGAQPAFQGLPELVAMEAGMPPRQWEWLAQAVEDAAGIKRAMAFGSADDSPTGPQTPEQKAYRARYMQRLQQDRVAAAPQAMQIRQLQEQVAQLESARTP